MKTLFKSIVLVFCETIYAQTNTTVVPFEAENQSGNGHDSLLDTSGQTQQLFRASYLANAWRNPVEITGVSFRVDEQTGSYSAVIPRVEIRLSTSPRTPEQMGLVYSSNKGADETTVFLHDSVSLFSAAGQSVNPFDLRFTFDRPFVYDPNAGNLLMYIAISNFAGGAEIDAQSYASLGGSPAGYVGPHFGGLVAPISEVTQFSFVQVPEPTVGTLLLVGGLVGLGSSKSIRHVTSRRISWGRNPRLRAEADGEF